MTHMPTVDRRARTIAELEYTRRKEEERQEYLLSFFKRLHAENPVISFALEHMTLRLEEMGVSDKLIALIWSTVTGVYRALEIQSEREGIPMIIVSENIYNTHVAIMKPLFAMDTDEPIKKFFSSAREQLQEENPEIGKMVNAVERYARDAELSVFQATCPIILMYHLLSTQAEFQTEIENEQGR